MADDDNTETEGLIIAARLHELADALGLNQRQLALRVGIDPRHFNSLWHGKKAAGMPLIMRIARKSGRSIAWVCGEEAARPQIGTVDAHGRVTMASDTSKISQGIIYFVDGINVFAAGERVLVDPSHDWSDGHWLLIRPRAGGEAWIGWARTRGEQRWLERLDREMIGYSEERHEIIGVIVGSIGPPPGDPSALR